MRRRAAQAREAVEIRCAVDSSGLIVGGVTFLASGVRTVVALTLSVCGAALQAFLRGPKGPARGKGAMRPVFLTGTNSHAPARRSVAQPPDRSKTGSVFMFMTVRRAAAATRPRSEPRCPARSQLERRSGTCRAQSAQYHGEARLADAFFLSSNVPECCRFDIGPK